MKSIKEKSEEYAREFVEPFVLYYTKDEVRQFEAQHEDSFEAGAYYVIGEIEKALNSKGMSRLKVATIKDVIDKLKESTI